MISPPFATTNPVTSFQNILRDAGIFRCGSSSGRRVSACRLAVNPFAQRNSGQLLIGGFLFIEIGRQQPHDIVASSSSAHATKVPYRAI